MSRSIKENFRMNAGYESQHTCEECFFIRRVKAGSRSHYKCEKMGITSSSATDIRLKDIACMWFVKADDVRK